MQLILEDDLITLKNSFFKNMLTECIPNFNWELFDYNYRDGKFQYNHNITELLIDGQIEGISILQNDLEEEEYWEKYFIVFSYKDEIYKVNYEEGSHGHKHELDIDTLKSVQPKVKEVIYYE